VLIAVLFVARFMKLFAIKYTMLPMRPQPPGSGKQLIRIIDGKSHATILERIKTRWKARLKQLHGAINFSNDVNKEIAKFTWMKDHAIITEGEYSEAVGKLRAYALQNRTEPAERTLN
jgi:hypothetical protein